MFFVNIPKQLYYNSVDNFAEILVVLEKQFVM